MIEICGGCGRRAAEEEVICAACGRPLRDATFEQHPQGWETMPEVSEPSVRPLRQDELSAAGPANDGDVEGATKLFLAHPPPEDSGTPGGRGWRVRISANPRFAGASGAAPAALDPSTASDIAARRLPQWIYPLLILSIVATSSAAVVLVVLHVLRSTS